MGVNNPEPAYFWDSTTKAWRRALYGEPGEFVWDSSTNSWVKGTVGAEYLWNDTSKSWVYGPGGQYVWNNTTKGWDRVTVPGYGGQYYWSNSANAWVPNAGGNNLDAYGTAHFIADFTDSYYRNNTAVTSSFSFLSGLTFTRASAGYAQTSAGVLVPFASGAARITDKGLLIEGARTTIAARSRRLDDASAWTLSNMTTSTVQGVDGVSGSATRLTAGGANATAIGISTTSGSSARRLAPFIRRVAGTGNVDISLDGGSTWNTQTITSSFARVAGLSQTLANPRVAVRIVSSGDSVDVDFANGETGAFDSSPMESGAANVTRAADVASIAVSGLAYPVTLFAEFERVVDTGSFENQITIDAGSSANRAELYVGSTDLGTAAMTSGGASQGTVPVAGSLAVGTVYRLAGRINTNSIQAARSGTLGTEDTTATLPSTPTTLYLGQGSGSGSPSFGYVKKAAVWPTAFSDANLQAVTA